MEKLESTDVGGHERNINSIATILNISFLDKFAVTPALRFDRTGNEKLHPTGEVKLSYNIFNGNEAEHHYGTGFRNPTFNDLYWPLSGNPDLKPEDSKYQSFKLKLNSVSNPLSNIYFNITDRYTDDLIQWVPIDETFFIWQPRNIARSHRTNFTIGSQYNLEKLPLQIASHI